MSRWTEQELALALGAPPVHTGPTSEFHGVSIDSRTTKPGNLFVCLKGERTDGHLYIESALSAGASALIVEEGFLAAGGIGLPEPGSLTVFSVPNGLEALQDLARHYRKRRSELVVIGITGSNGKTSAKEMLLGLLSSLQSQDSVFATPGNLNNHIGLPLSILAVPEDCSWAVLEMGMNHAGEIALLSRIARPNHALVTSISGAHMEFFSSITDIARAKLEITEGLLAPASGPSVFSWPKAAPLQREVATLAQRRNLRLLLSRDAASLVKTGGCRIGREGLELRFEGRTIRNPYYFSHVMGANLLAALRLLLEIGFSSEELCEAASSVRPLTPGRFSVQKRKRPSASDQLIVDDSYNANPASFEAALRALRALLPEGRLALFAGEMAELGEGAEESHRAIGEIAAELGYELVALSGDKYAQALELGYRDAYSRRSGSKGPAEVMLAKDSKELACCLSERPAAFWDSFDGILVKGSRSARMERTLEIFKK